MKKINFKKVPNLITISGKVGSGKDTVERIIQAFMIRGKSPNPHEIHGSLGYEMLNDIELTKRVVSGSEWYGDETYLNKKFADKLKDMVCLLLGCTRKQLEDRDYKENELDSKWDVWRIECDNEISFDGTSLIEGGIFLTKKEAKDFIKEHNIINYTRVYKSKSTPRLILQLLGTECGRQIIHPNIWVNALFSDYTPIHTDHAEGGFEYPRWIITDTRFKNEIDSIEKFNGIRIRINRSKKTSQEWQSKNNKIKVLDPDGWDRKNYQYSWFEELITIEEFNARVFQSTCLMDNNINEKPHQSEIDLDDYNKWDYIIENDGTLLDLVHKVHDILFDLSTK
jgi:dephospho-CoA kinase